MKKFNIKQLILSFLLVMITAATVMASSHREAPLISNDPLADNVDVYAFRSPDNPDMITLIATYIPFQLPQGGPNYYTFGENIRYEIHVDNDASIVGDEVTYRFTFKIENEDPTTFFNMRLGKQNQKATYTLERSMDGGATFTTIVENGIVPPNNIGDRSITGGAGLNTSYDALWNGGITTASTGETVFAGPSDDPFFVDLGGIFDLGDAPRQDGNPVDGVGCYNVSTLAIQVPISTLLKAGAPATPTDILDPDYVIGVWASASRPAMQTISATNAPEYSGEWVQVSRLGMPLTNEAVIPIGYKDFWNAITPYQELAETEMDEFFYNPELALYMDDDQFGGAVPAFANLRIQTAALGAFDFTNGADGVSALAGGDLTGTAFEAYGSLLLIPGKPRAVDLWPIFHTGVPNAIPYQLATGKEGNPLAAGKPFINNFLPNGGDMLRLNMAVPPTPRDDPNFSSLGLVQAAAIGLTVAPFNTTADLEFIPNMDGFPNGRRLEDDVTRIELQAVGGVVLAAIGLWYDDYDPMTSPSPVTEDLLNVLTYTTGVESNDRPFLNSFPYVAQPFSGTGGCSGEIIIVDPVEEVVNSTFFVSGNTEGFVGVFDILDNGAVRLTNFESQAMDADGLHYDEDLDVLYQLNRTENVINAYSKVLENIRNGLDPELTATSSSDFVNGREIAVVGNKLVVAQDASDDNGMVNRFITYDVSPTEITLDKSHDVTINLWGIHMTQNDMYAIVDNSSDVAVFENFFDAPVGVLNETRRITVDGIVRTHGITYVETQDLMILTDVGSGADPADGAIVTITDFTSKAEDDFISLDEQNRIEGESTFLGNPVDVAYDELSTTMYIAERANNGGRVLGFNIDDNGDVAPSYDQLYPGVSAIYSNDYRVITQAIASTFFASSNTDGVIGVFDVINDGSLNLTSFSSQAMDADGIYYDNESDVLYQLNRTDNVINAYSDVLKNLRMGESPTLSATSTSDFINGREIAVVKGKLVVAQDADDVNGMVNRFISYDITPTSIVLDKVHDVSVNLWGIHMTEKDLYAIVDNSSDVVIFENFIDAPSGTLTESRRITIDGIIRTHGITYVETQDLMILTDVGSGADPEDGALITITNFSDKSTDGTISIAEQTRIEGASTLLGNPVDVAYDEFSSTMFIAERANNGGRVLGFNIDDSGNVAPSYDQNFPGASAIFSDNYGISTAIIDVDADQLDIKVFPNPTSASLSISIDGKAEIFGNATVTVLSVDGRVMMNSKMNNSTKSVDVTPLPDGMYILNISNDKFSHSTRFMKVK